MSITWWIGKKTCGYFHTREHYSDIKRNEALLHLTIWINFKTNMLCERSQTQKITYHMIPFIWNVQIRQILKDRIHCGFKSLGGGRNQFSHSVVAHLCVTCWHHGLQHARPPCPSQTSGVCSHSCPSCWWCHPIVSSSVIPFSYLQSFPVSGSFPMSQFFIKWPKYWSFSFSISPSKEYSGLISIRIDWFDLLVVQGTLKSLQHHS